MSDIRKPHPITQDQEMKGDGHPAGLTPDLQDDPGLRYLIVDRNVVNDPLTQNEWTQKRLVWVPSGEMGFVQGGIKVSQSIFDFDWGNGFCF